MSSSAPSPRRPSRRLVPRNLLTYDERRKLAEPAKPLVECVRRNCSEPVQEGSCCCVTHTSDLARLKADLDRPWDWKEGKTGSRPRRSQAASAGSAAGGPL